mmetsp:Transcript_48530/g.80694  ORF Transcript_48530/g.80694 Transcript_48530/m.80694 type:complete len:968 (-) Transcript_48530:92-2995(-)
MYSTAKGYASTPSSARGSILRSASKRSKSFIEKSESLTAEQICPWPAQLLDVLLSNDASCSVQYDEASDLISVVGAGKIFVWRPSTIQASPVFASELPKGVNDTFSSRLSTSRGTGSREEWSALAVTTEGSLFFWRRLDRSNIAAETGSIPLPPGASVSIVSSCQPAGFLVAASNGALFHIILEIPLRIVPLQKSQGYGFLRRVIGYSSASSGVVGRPMSVSPGPERAGARVMFVLFESCIEQWEIHPLSGAKFISQTTFAGKEVLDVQVLSTKNSIHVYLLCLDTTSTNTEVYKFDAAAETIGEPLLVRKIADRPFQLRMTISENIILFNPSTVFVGPSTTYKPAGVQVFLMGRGPNGSVIDRQLGMILISPTAAIASTIQPVSSLLEGPIDDVIRRALRLAPEQGRELVRALRSRDPSGTDEAIRRLVERTVDGLVEGNEAWAEDEEGQAAVLLQKQLLDKTRQLEELFLVVPEFKRIPQLLSKLASAAALRNYYNSETSHILKKLIMQTVQDRVSAASVERYFSEVSRIDDILGHVEQSLHLKAVEVVTNNEVLKAIFRPEDFGVAVPFAATSREANEWRLTERTANLIRKQIEISVDCVRTRPAQDISERIRVQLESLVSMLLEHHCSMEETHASLGLLVELGRLSAAEELAKKYEDYDMLIQLCEKTPEGQQRLQSHLRVPGFLTTYFDWCYKNSQISKLFGVGGRPEFKEQLTQYLSDKPHLRWIQDISLRRFSEAGTTLLSEGFKGSKSAADAKALLSIGKLAWWACTGRSMTQAETEKIRQTDLGLYLLNVQSLVTSPSSDDSSFDDDGDVTRRGLPMQSPDWLVEKCVQSGTRDGFLLALDVIHKTEEMHSEEQLRDLRLRVWSAMLSVDGKRWHDCGSLADLSDDQQREALRSFEFYSVIIGHEQAYPSPSAQTGAWKHMGEFIEAVSGEFGQDQANWVDRTFRMALSDAHAANREG